MNEGEREIVGFIFFQIFGGMPRHEGGMLRHVCKLRFCPWVACRGMKEACCGMELSGKCMGI